MSTTAEQAWTSLDTPWHNAFEQAWASWCAGNLGIGAVLIDPVDGEVVSVGRNRVSERTEQVDTISGNFMAHAEMNAFAAMDRFKANGLHLYTTLEPCVMCAATIIFLHVDRVHFAAADEYFGELEGLWLHHVYTAKWQPERRGPLPSALAGFARVLPLTISASTDADGPVMRKAGEAAPSVAGLAIELAADRTLHTVAESGGSVTDALAALWSRLPG